MDRAVKHRFGAILFLALFLPCCIFAQEQKQDVAAKQQRIPVYEDSAGGLRNLFKDILAAAKANQQDVLDGYFDSFVMPDPNNWFSRVFGNRAGRDMAGYYVVRMKGFASQWSAEITAALRDRLKDVEVIRFEESCNPTLLPLLGNFLGPTDITGSVGATRSAPLLSGSASRKAA